MPVPQSSDQGTVFRACEFCRTRKIRCDSNKPKCGSCVTQNRQCLYGKRVRQARPTVAIIKSVREEKHRYIQLLRRLKSTPQEDLRNFLDSIALPGEGDVDCSDFTMHPTSEASEAQIVHAAEDEDSSSESPESTLDVSTFLSVDDKGSLNPFGPSSALHSAAKVSDPRNASDLTHIKNKLVANAILTRQCEFEIYDKMSHVDQVPIELAMHLLNLHWNRQHHTFLLTYRPAVMRDLVTGGPYSSSFMMNAIFACSSKFSDRLDIREDIDNPLTAGARFFRRCDDLLRMENLLLKPSVPTVVGLLLLGSTYNARGEVSKGWLHTGYGLRMIYDLGLHLDRDVTMENAEDIEIRRRVFWGAFINDKLQSLYLGRPIAIHIQDIHVSLDFMDIIDEREPWVPYTSQCHLDNTFGDSSESHQKFTPTPMFSVSCFREFCRLSKIMTRIINNFYVIGANAASAKASLKSIEESLNWWKANLPPQLRFDPLAESLPQTSRCPTPNILNLHGIYYSLIILLYRPFVAGGHLRSNSTAGSPSNSWQNCTKAAKNITNIAARYKNYYTLRGAPYLLSYALYVACTIHVRNVAASCEENRTSSENYTQLSSSLRCLDELTLPNPGVSRPAKIIRNLMASMKVEDGSATMVDLTKPPHFNHLHGNDFGEQPQDQDFDLEVIISGFAATNPPELARSNATGGVQTDNETNALSSGGWLMPSYKSQQDLLYGFMDVCLPTYEPFILNDGDDFGVGETIL